jgi:hypothetical protein
VSPQLLPAWGPLQGEPVEWPVDRVELELQRSQVCMWVEVEVGVGAGLESRVWVLVQV